MKQSELVPHLFRTHYSRIVAVLSRHFGLEHLETAEDLATEAFVAALQSWPYHGIPQNPVAWLYRVAKNKAKNHLIRRQTFQHKVRPQVQQALPGSEETEIDASEGTITDSQLQMLFAVCHPSIPTEAQVGLALRILCGFGIEEIATAFLTSKETINKRLFRAREKLRLGKVSLQFPAEAETENRLDAVLTTLYLLFSEGYYSESQEAVLREDLCWEAIRLTQLLVEHPRTDLPAVHALLALMYFQASRFAARKDASGALILYQDQDQAQWDQALIAQGAVHLRRAATGSKLNKYHLEAAIAYWYTVKADSSEKWEAILQLYNQLLMLEYSPIAALNRTYALARVKGKEAAIGEAQRLNLENNPYYFALLGELYREVNAVEAKSNYQKAFRLAKTSHDKQLIQAKLDQLP